MRKIMLRDILSKWIIYTFIAFLRPTLENDTNEDKRLQLHPNETTVFAGDSFIFYCSKEKNASSPVDWYHIPTGERDRIHIYKSAIDEFYITNSVNYQTYFSVDYNVSTGDYNLRIRNVSVMYAGVYFCVDTNVGQSTKQTELIVIDSPPLCQTNVSGEGALGENSCNLPPDYIGFSCSVNYRGNLAPILELYHDAGKDINETSVSNQVRYNSRSPAVIGTKVSSNMNGMFFHCEVKTVVQFPPHSKNLYRCNSSAIKVVYAMNSTASEVVTRREGTSSCTINTNSHMMCEYKWKSQNKFPKTLILHRDLFHNDSTFIGSYRCMADCNLTGHYCSLEGQFVEFVAQNGDRATKWFIIAWIFIGLSVAVPLLIVVLFYKWKQHHTSILKMKMQQTEQEKLIQEYKPSPMPDPPKGPLKACELMDGSVELQWKPPLKMEGMIYRIEKQIVGKTEWKRIDETVEISSDIKLQVKSLEQNKMYNFRIFSQNKFGESSKPLETKEPIRVGIVYDMNLVETLEVKDYKCVEAVGLTYLCDKIYVLFRKFKHVLVFSGESPFGRLTEDEIDIKNIDYPFDMTSVQSAAQPPTIFISDCSYANQCLWKIDVRTQTKTKCSVEGKPKRLSTTSNNNLLVIVEFKSCYHFDIYSSNGEFSKRTALPYSITNPLNVIENSEWSFIFMYKRIAGDLDSKYVIEIDNVVKSKSKIIELPFLEDSRFEPECLAISEDNKIFIADNKGDRVFLFDPSTKHHQIISKQDHQIKDPCRLIYIKEKQQLIVCQFQKPFVKIFKQHEHEASSMTEDPRCQLVYRLDELNST